MREKAKRTFKKIGDTVYEGVTTIGEYVIAGAGMALGMGAAFGTVFLLSNAISNLNKNDNNSEEVTEE